ncbi:MAG: phosphoribosylaminoimidazolesuccinocarboxamide synthase [Bacteroidales bacterium]|nr:phosphoribosylaminoimidazolesuccinocarboxamide synthase [Bacteroidales bacterium]
MNKKEFLYDGKAKEIYATDVADQVLMYYKDDATAYHGVKKSPIRDKGMLNNRISELIFTYLNRKGIPTHFIKRVDDQHQLCHKLSIIPLEFVTRNIIAGALSRRLDIEEGRIPDNPIVEICYKNDDLRDPFVNETHVLGLKIATSQELAFIQNTLLKINELLLDLFNSIGIMLVDFKVEFGRDKDGNILLADEISPDSARFWDKNTRERLDKDRFKRDMGKVEESYRTVLKRLEQALKC